jgi:hypothetical protein
MVATAITENICGKLLKNSGTRKTHFILTRVYWFIIILSFSYFSTDFFSFWKRGVKYTFTAQWLRSVCGTARQFQVRSVTCDLLAEANSVAFICVMPSLVSKVHKTSSSRLETNAGFRGCGLCSCSLHAETNCFGPVAIFFLSCLVPS